MRMAWILLILFSLLAGLSQAEPGQLLIVDASNSPSEDLDGDGLFRTITAAVQAARSGDLITVAPGRYDASLGESFPITIDKDLTIEASGGPAETVIDASGAAGAIEIRRGSVAFHGFTLQGASGSRAAGIAVMGSVRSVKISGNVVQDIATVEGSYSFGIRIYQVETGLVEVADNVVQRVAGNGISVGHSSAAVEVRGNIVRQITRAMIDDVEYSVGIALNASTGVTVEGNDVSQAALGISLMGSTGCLVRRNSVHDNFQPEPVSHALLTLAGVEITTPGEEILLAFGSHGNAILENEIEANGTGIGLYLADGNQIGGNLVRNNRATTIAWQGEIAHGLGIAVDYSNRNLIFDSTIQGNGDVGLVLKNAALNLVQRNLIADHADSGIIIVEGSGRAANAISGNEVSGAGVGIKVKSGFSEINRNAITANGVGIELMQTAEARDHAVEENNIFGNGFGFVNNGRGLARAEENWWGDLSGP
ncbi:MAG: right-handed parallel beta-helix repeat-containing protein [Candidatus Acetothermia bacterium]|nr:right-handed parallel beta-helix repeat-containing protein [Candidatus Acetothermia bacterium]